MRIMTFIGLLILIPFNASFATATRSAAPISRCETCPTEPHTPHPYLICELNGQSSAPATPWYQVPITGWLDSPLKSSRQVTDLQRFGSAVTDRAFDTVLKSRDIIGSMLNCLSKASQSVTAVQELPACAPYRAYLTKIVPAQWQLARLLIALSFNRTSALGYDKPQRTINAELTYDWNFPIAKTPEPLEAAEALRAERIWLEAQRRALFTYILHLRQYRSHLQRGNPPDLGLNLRRSTAIIEAYQGGDTFEEQWVRVSRATRFIPFAAFASYPASGRQVRRPLHFGRWVAERLRAFQDENKARLLTILGSNPTLAFLSAPEASLGEISEGLTRLRINSEDLLAQINDQRFVFAYGQPAVQLEAARDLLINHPMVVRALQEDLSLCSIASTIFFHELNRETQELIGRVSLSVAAGLLLPGWGALLVIGGVESYFLMDEVRAAVRSKAMFLSGVDLAEAAHNEQLGLIETAALLNQTRQVQEHIAEMILLLGGNVLIGLPRGFH